MLKIVQGATFTRVDTICDGQSDGQTGTQAKPICLLTLKGGDSDKKMVKS